MAWCQLKVEASTTTRIIIVNHHDAGFSLAIKGREFKKGGGSTKITKYSGLPSIDLGLLKTGISLCYND
jgi:hypothetical protein